MKPYFDNSMSIDDHQSVSNSSTSKIEKDCKWILKYLMASSSPIQALFIPVFSILVASLPRLKKMTSIFLSAQRHQHPQYKYSLY